MRFSSSSKFQPSRSRRCRVETLERRRLLSADLAAGAEPLAATAEVATPPAPEGTRLGDFDPSTLPDLALGTGTLAYWSSSWTFADLVKLDHRGWSYYKADSGRVVPIEHLDSIGNVIAPAEGTDQLRLSLHPFQNMRVNGKQTLEIPRGRYVFEYEGDAVVTFRGAVGEINQVAPGRIELDVTETGSNYISLLADHQPGQDPATYIKNAHFWMPDPRDPTARSLAPSDQAELGSEAWTSTFHPDYLDHLIDVGNTSNDGELTGALRFMDWLHTNHASSVDWNDRRLPGALFPWGENYQRGDFRFEVPLYEGRTHQTGVPWEYISELGNATGKDVWINLPHAANDQYIRNAAKVLRFGSNADGVPYDSVQDEYGPSDHPPLRSDLRVFVEYSNEAWNYGFAQRRYIDAEGAAAGYDAEPGAAFAGARAAETWAIFSEVFADDHDRVINVAGAWTANPRYTRAYLSQSQAADNPEIADVLGITTYFGQPLVNYIFEHTDWRNATDYAFGSGDEVADAVIDQSLDHLVNELVLPGTGSAGEQGTDAGGFGSTNVELAHQYQLPLVSYEGNNSTYLEGRITYVQNAAVRPDGTVDLSLRGQEKIVSKGTPGATRIYSLNNYVQEYYIDAGWTTKSGQPAANFAEAVYQLNREEAFADAYRAVLDTAKDLGLYTHNAFVGIAKPGKHGQWGHKEYLSQPVGYGPGEAVKWQGLRDWEAEHEVLRERGVGTPAIGTRPQWPDVDLTAAFAGDNYDQTLTVIGGEGNLDIQIRHGSLPDGLTATADGRSLRISGTISPDATVRQQRFMVRVVDGDNEPDWHTYTIEVLDADGSTTTVRPQKEFSGFETQAPLDNPRWFQVGSTSQTLDRRIGVLEYDLAHVIGEVDNAFVELPIRQWEGSPDSGASAVFQAFAFDQPDDAIAFETGVMPELGRPISARVTVQQGEPSARIDLTDAVAHEAAGDGTLTIGIFAVSSVGRYSRVILGDNDVSEALASKLTVTQVPSTDVVAEPTTVSMAPIADTFGDPASSSQRSLGTGRGWVVGSRGRRGYFQFDVSSIDGPVTSASIQFYSHRLEGDAGIASAFIERVDDDGGLNETVAYGSVPESGSTISEVVTGLDTNTRLFEIQITDLDYLQSQIDGDGTFSTALRINVQGGINRYVGMAISSRELGVRGSQYIPTLTITTGSPPPPVTFENFAAGDVLTDAIDPTFLLRDLTLAAEQPLDIIATADGVGLRLSSAAVTIGRVDRQDVDLQTLQLADVSGGNGATVRVTAEDAEGQTRTWTIDVPAAGIASLELDDAAGLSDLRVETITGVAALIALN